MHLRRVRLWHIGCCDSSPMKTHSTFSRDWPSDRAEFRAWRGLAVVRRRGRVRDRVDVSPRTLTPPPSPPPPPPSRYLPALRWGRPASGRRADQDAALCIPWLAAARPDHERVPTRARRPRTGCPSTGRGDVDKPRRGSATRSGRPGSTNCGRNARKNSATLGFSRLTTKASANSRFSASRSASPRRHAATPNGST